ncbi:MAG: tyrosine-type recombinase/integrase [Candidatus Obscuribacterales bacterium]|nr:tyrosine-type recombinase/integrase [Candidatus Obscuribacterales bacterium]
MNNKTMKLVVGDDEHGDSSKNAITLRQVWRDYLLVRRLKPKTINVHWSMLERCVGDWLDLDMNDITKDMVEIRHRELSKNPAQANSVFRIVRTLYNFGICKYEQEDESPVLKRNPVKRLSALRAWNKDKARSGHIPLHRLEEWCWHVLMLNNSTMRDFLLLLMLTGLRLKEGQRLSWSDVDLESKVITIRDTKNGTDHALPVSTLLERILRNRKVSSSSPFVFPGRRGRDCLTWPYKSIEGIIERSGIQFAPHDLRRTFNLLAEESGVDSIIRKRLLNHSSQDVTEKHYAVRNPNQLRSAMNAIDRKVRKLIGPLAKLFGEDIGPSDHRLLALSPIARSIIPSQSVPSTSSELCTEPIISLGQQFVGAQQILVEAKIIQVLIKSGSGTKKDFYRKIGACFAVSSLEMERILGEMVERRIIRRYRQEWHWRYEITEVV